MNEIYVEREIGGRMLRFETGKVAKLASGAIIARYAESAVLCTAMRADPRPGLDFFPLQCDYRERLTDRDQVREFEEIAREELHNLLDELLEVMVREIGTLSADAGPREQATDKLA